tara:strand:+ start:2180 stop:2614 length:435 start_codon:yes stop_codon:yes gene_type:complete
MKRLELLGKKVNSLASVDIYENTRKRATIEARSLFNFVAYKYFLLTFDEIAKFLKTKGKTSDHSTILHSLRNFELYSFHNTNLNGWLEDIISSDKFDKRMTTKMVARKMQMLNEKDIKEIAELVDFKYINNLHTEILPADEQNN